MTNIKLEGEDSFFLGCSNLDYALRKKEPKESSRTSSQVDLQLRNIGAISRLSMIHKISYCNRYSWFHTGMQKMSRMMKATDEQFESSERYLQAH